MSSQETVLRMDGAKTATKLELARQRLIVALDVPDSKSAMRLVAELEGTCNWFKVGLELFLAAGPAVLEPIVARGHSVFLDLKLHDIPNTVAGAVRSAVGLGVRMLTVHAGGGPAMLAAAKRRAGGSCRSAGTAGGDGADEHGRGATRVRRSESCAGWAGRPAGNDGVERGDSRICLLGGGG